MLLVGLTYPDAAEPLAQLTIERQCAARTRFVVRGQAVSLASLERARDFRAARCLMWIKDSSVKRRDRIPQRRYRFFRRPERFWVPPPARPNDSRMHQCPTGPVTLDGAVASLTI